MANLFLQCGLVWVYMHVGRESLYNLSSDELGEVGPTTIFSHEAEKSACDLVYTHYHLPMPSWAEITTCIPFCHFIFSLEITSRLGFFTVLYEFMLCVFVYAFCDRCVWLARGSV